MVKSIIFASAITTALGQSAGSLTKEVHPPLSYSVCKSSGCKKYDSSVVIDSNWRWTHIKGETTNCYTGNEWDKELCPDAATCSKNCEIEGADKEYEGTYGVKTDGNKLSLQFVTEGPYTTNIGSRLYMLDQRNDNQYKMFNLKNREFTFTVDDKEIGCGLNGALYFVGMEKDGGKATHGSAGANYGTGYCDAQCPHDLKWINNEANVEDWVPSETDDNAGTGKYGTCCTEIDLWEANHISTAFTMHACSTKDDLPYRCHGTLCGDNGEDRFSGVCDKNGCDIQAWRFGVRDFYGPSDKFKVNSAKPVTVTTQFLTDDGTDSGTIVKAKQFYTQNGKTFEHPMYTINGKPHKTISDEMCADWVAETKDGTNFLAMGGMGSVDTVFKNGAVLVMSLWDDHYANMLWLDSIYPVDVTDCAANPGACRGSCAITSGVPADVEKNVPNATIHFSDIKYGRIGTTIQMSDPITV
jgi:cellulose 1,4-beta-cellobiosidase